MEKDKDALFIIEPCFFGKKYIDTCIKLDIQPVIILRRDKKYIVNTNIGDVIYADVRSYSEIIIKIKEYIKTHRYRRMGIIQGNEYSGEVAGKVAEYFGWKYNSSEDAAKSHNKEIMRKAIDKYSADLNPKYKIIKKYNDLEECLKKISYPLIVKPANMTCSMYVKKVKNNMELRNHIESILDIDDNFGYDTPKKILVEEYINYQEYSFDGIINEGKCAFCGIVEKQTTDGEFFVEIQHKVPAILKSEDEKYIKEKLLGLLENMGYKNTTFHIEFRYSNRSIKIMEYATRLPGGSIVDLYKFAYGVDLYSASIMSCLGYDIDRYTEVDRKKYSCIRFIQICPGRIKSISGIDKIKSMESVVKFTLDRNEGEFIPKLESNDDRYGYYILVGNSEQEIEEDIKKVDSLLKVEIDKEGNYE